MTRGERTNALDEGPAVLKFGRARGHVDRHDLWVDACLKARHSPQDLRLRGEPDAVIVDQIVQWLLTDGVSSEMQAIPRLVMKAKSKHPIEFIEASEPLLAQPSKEYSGVSRPLEFGTFDLQSERSKVVNFTVVDQLPRRAITDRLVRLRTDVEHREPSVAERYSWPTTQVLVIRSAMHQRIHQRGEVMVMKLSSRVGRKDAKDSTHREE